jgi:hypothetical protein
MKLFAIAKSNINSQLSTIKTPLCGGQMTLRGGFNKNSIQALKKGERKV